MRSFVGSLILVSACAVIAGCGPKAEESQRPVHPDVLAKAGLHYYWKVDLGLGENETVERLYLLDENLYCLTNRNRLMALDAARGLLKWIHIVADPSQTLFRPVHADKVLLSEKVSGIREILSPETIETLEPFDAVMINSLTSVIVLDRSTGSEIRRIAFDFTANTGGATDGRCFYVGATSGRYYSIILQEAVKGWTLSTGDLLSAPLMYEGGNLYVAGEDGIFRATKINGRARQLWSQRLEGPVTAAFFVDGARCLVPCEDNRLYAFDPYGQRLWEPFVCQGPLRQAVQVAAKTIFQYAEGDSFYAIEPEGGEKKWSLPQGRKVLAVLNADVFLLDADGRLQIVDEAQGTVKTTIPMTGLDLFVANTSKPAVYAASRAGGIFCIRPISAGRLTGEMLE